MDVFFNANSIDDEKKNWSLLSTVGNRAYAKVRTFVRPAKPKKEYMKIVESLSNRVSPPLSEIAERLRFNARALLDNECTSVFVAELRQMGEHCNFGIILSRIFRDSLVCSIRDKFVQQRHLEEKSLALDRALQVTSTAEAAERKAAELEKGEHRSLRFWNSEGQHKLREVPHEKAPTGDQ